VKRFKCLSCGHGWEVPEGTPVFYCPKCHSFRIEYLNPWRRSGRRRKNDIEA
jgi:predicted RNA-binding Zn-ribbon protein involved in translation (DUF1610 family)